MRVLIVEDEPRLAKNIALALTEEMSFAVDTSHEGQDGLHMALTNQYDLIILDLMLPMIDGLKILQTIRNKEIKTPVLILTARDQKADIIHGLNLGSDDYMTKPFDMEELIARCRALIRRAHGQPAPIINIDKLAIDTGSHTVTFCGKTTLLPAMEYRLLEYLALKPGQIVSKTEILEHLYDFNAEVFSNVIEVYISSIRKKLDPGNKNPFIHTIRGHGYLLGEPIK